MTSSQIHERVPLKYVTSITSGGTPKSDAANWNGIVPFVTPPDLNGLDGKLVESWGRSLTSDAVLQGSTLVSDAVLLSCRAPIGHIGSTLSPVAFNQGCKALKPVSAHDLRFLAYALVSERAQLGVKGRGTTFMELSTSDLADCTVPWPNAPSTRERIADYLDRETGQIDAMIAKMDQLAEQLESRRLAAIDRAFADLRGARNASAHLVADITVGIVIEPAKLYVPSGQGVPALRGINIAPGHIKSDDLVEISHQGHAANRKSELQTGDLVTVRTGRVGTTAVIPDEWAGSNAIDLVITRPHAGQSARYLYWLLCSSEARSHIEGQSVGAVQSHFNVTGLKRLPVPVIPFDEQERIADHLDEVTNKIDAMLAKVAELKSLLTERRAALISEVVTGRKEVA